MLLVVMLRLLLLMTVLKGIGKVIGVVGRKRGVVVTVEEGRGSDEASGSRAEGTSADRTRYPKEKR